MTQGTKPRREGHRERHGVALFVTAFPLIASAACSEPQPSKNSPVSADTILDRARRLSNLQSAPLDPSCCAVEARASASVQPTLVKDDSAPDAFEILFDSGSAEVGRSAERAIHALADYLILHPEIQKVELGGYADIHGTVESNERLGARRAEAVKRVLIRHSVAPDRLLTKSYGATALAASSTTAKGMRQNRRVVIRIIEPAGTERRAAEP